MTKKYNLFDIVVSKSNSDIWEDAVSEWDIIAYEEDEDCDSSCVCGHSPIKYLYTIQNRDNDNIIFPIGSECIKKFNRDDLKEKIDIIESMFELFKAIKNEEYIELDKKLFSKKLIKHLYEQNVFEPNKYNNFDAYNDYEFMLKMFRKRKERTEKEKRKINALIAVYIKPYLEKILKFKN